MHGPQQHLVARAEIARQTADGRRHEDEDFLPCVWALNLLGSGNGCPISVALTVGKHV